TLGRPVLGSKESIASVTRDQVRGFYRRHYIPPHFVVAAAGNLKHDELCRLIESSMDTGPKLSAGERPKVRLGGSVPSPSGGTLVRNRKTEQAHICVGTAAFSRREPDREVRDQPGRDPLRGRADRPDRRGDGPGGAGRGGPGVRPAHGPRRGGAVPAERLPRGAPGWGAGGGPGRGRPRYYQPSVIK